MDHVLSASPDLFAPAMFPVLNSLQDLPFLHIRNEADGYRVDGLTHCLLGHQIPRGDGRPDGIYATWEWTGTKLTVRNDRYGFYPLFYFADAKSICVSPVIARLLSEGADRTINDPAMAAFLRLGYFLGEDTPFRNIHCLPPDAELEWSSEGLKVRGARVMLNESSISRTAALDGYIDLFRQSIRRRPPTTPDYVLPLSGGRDSRHIFLELCAQGWKPGHCVTVDLPHETDAQIAAQLAEPEGVRLHSLPPTEIAFKSEIRRNLEASFCSDEHTWALHIADYLAAHSTCSYDGIGGDVLSASRFINPERQSRFEAGEYVRLAQELVSPNDAFTTATLPPELRKRWSSSFAIERVEAELRRCAEAANPMAAFVFWNRTRREIALYPYGFLRKTPCVYAPFLDHDLHDHLAALPARMLLDRKFHDDAIRIAYPKAAHIPFASKTGASLTTNASLARLATDVLGCLVKADQKTWVRATHYALRLIRARIQTSMRGEAFSLGTRCLYMLQLEHVWAKGLP